MSSLLRRALAKLRHPFNLQERVYLFPDPWGMERPSEQYRFAETNTIIAEHIDPVKTILEIGSGEGHQSEWLQKLGVVHGIESSTHAVKRAQKRVPGATFEVGSLPNLSHVHADLICAFEILYYLSDAELAAAIKALNAAAPHRMVSYHQHPKTVTKLDPVVLSIPGVQSTVIAFNEHRWTVAWW